MMMQVPRLWLLMLVAMVSVCVTSGQQYKGKGYGYRKNPCDGYYCANGGSCILDEGDEYRYSIPSCQCAGNWTGERCDDNPCTDVDCNSGTCYFDCNGTPHCCCPEGTTGDFCVNPEMPCSHVCKLACEFEFGDIEITSETCAYGGACCAVGEAP